MTKRLIMPAAVREAAESLNLSPGVASGGHLFLTGATGGDADGRMPAGIEAQARNAFAKIGAVLAEAGLTHDAIVEMTTYHVGLRDHFEAFDAIRLNVFAPPYPAWTAVEVAGLRRKGALVEIRVIAALDQTA